MRPLDRADGLLPPALARDHAYWRGKPPVTAIPRAGSAGGLPEALDPSALRSWAEQTTSPPPPLAWSRSAVIDRALLLAADFDERRRTQRPLDIPLSTALLFQHAEFLAQPAGRSDVIRGAIALAAVALVVPELRASRRWLRRALRRISTVAEHAAPSGLVPGRTLAEIVGNARALSAAVGLLSSNGVAVQPNVTAAAVRGEATLQRLIRSDGSVAFVPNRFEVPRTAERSHLIDFDAGVAVLRGFGDRHVTVEAAAGRVGVSVYGAGCEWLSDFGVTTRHGTGGGAGRLTRATRSATESLASFRYRVAGAEVCRTVRLRPSGVLLVTDVVSSTNARPQLFLHRVRPGAQLGVEWTADGFCLSDGNRAALVTFSAGTPRAVGDDIVVDSGRPRTRWTATIKVSPA